MYPTDLTVAAVVERDGRYLLVEEHAMGLVVLSQPGGHIEAGESPEQAVVREVLEETGCTVHYVDEVYDRGPVILQRKVPVKPDDTPETLQERVQEAEREAYPEAVNLYAEKRLMQVAQSVRILPVSPEKAGASS